MGCAGCKATGWLVQGFLQKTSIRVALRIALRVTRKVAVRITPRFRFWATGWEARGAFQELVSRLGIWRS